MNCLSLNARGIKGKGKSGWISGLRLSQGVDFLAIQESKTKDLSQRPISSCWGNSSFNCEFVNSDGIVGGGLISWWDPSCFRVSGVFKSKHVLIISGLLIHSAVHVNVANIHAPNDPSSRRASWYELLLYRRSLLGLWILLGDFNEVRSSDGRINSEFFSQNVIAFNDFIRDTELVEYNYSGLKYTYMSAKGDKMSKLDKSWCVKNL
ncbi:uncharacterized protein LOC110919544 [Helianthus annuus]|uniref:uncharacterized protein LOC110919544 n=1 Tax=Helianthus annuus TaxID=4232 RepID=UPI000B8FDB3A|nr:uncharacterized protein LOC110919544 [Helianthus annuus]